MSVKGWNFKLLIAVGHGSKRGRRVRLPSSAPFETLGIVGIPRVFYCHKRPVKSTSRCATVGCIAKFGCESQCNRKMVAWNATFMTSCCLAIANNRKSRRYGNSMKGRT